MNAQLVQSQKLEALGVMARGIAHDFNNLLTPVMASADLLSSEPPGSTFDRYIQNIISGARRASDLCRQLLAYGGSLWIKTCRWLMSITPRFDKLF